MAAEEEAAPVEEAAPTLEEGAAEEAQAQAQDVESPKSARSAKSKSSSKRSKESKDEDKTQRILVAAPAWKCRSFPQLHASLEGHMYSKSCRMGLARWENPHLIAGTAQWYEANKGSHKRHAQDPDRASWIPHAKGAVHGNPSKVDPPIFGYQPPGGARWSPIRHPNGAPKKTDRKGCLMFACSPHNSSKASSLGQAFFNTSKSAGDLSLARSVRMSTDTLPSIEMGHPVFPYPPSPAFTREFMRRQVEVAARGGGL
eukprot:TRINITY_DN50651_c0_g1_i1.p1 TRINITY_DN50651_c0_g1~~TRINITY_DN50651_c0_g1_i1.p1  ORF type:complete len:257 (-),score=44.85 TRINITY_DN50651_c0_g1_i1:144-914(-)